MLITKARLAFIFSCFLPYLAFADHEPISYSFAAKRGNLPSRNLTVFQPSTNGAPWLEDLNSDPIISRKLDDILNGDPKVGLAALAVNRGKVVYERYIKDEKDNLYPSWSMSKSITSLVVGHALCEKKIQSLDDRADKYSEELKGTPWGEAKIRDLLTMSSGASLRGLDTTTGEYAYGASAIGYAISRGRISISDGFKMVGNDEDKKSSGGAFAYNNLDTEALALVIAGATREPFHEYFNRKIWSAIQAEYRGLWVMDNKKQAIAHAYFFASMRDFAKLGQYVIDISKGRTNDDCLTNYVKTATSGQKHAGGNFWYGYQFWIYGLRGNTFAMWGHQGQEIIIDTSTEKIIVVTAYQGSIRKKYRDPQNLLLWLQAQ
jgi:CubicO group peptidase (beta-lactamase class C family)